MTIAQQITQASQDMPDIEAAARGLYIDGEWRPSRSGKTIDVVDPSTGAVLATVPDATIEDARASIDAAAAAAPAWRATPPRKRSEILLSLIHI